MKKSKRQDNIFKVIPIDIFCTDVLLSVNQTDDELYHYLDKDFTKKDFNMFWEDWKSDARVITTFEHSFIILRFRNELKKTPDMYGLIAHEAYHVACSILSKNGIKKGRKTEEVYAYLIQYIVREIVNINT
jgi:hypothetical protein